MRLACVAAGCWLSVTPLALGQERSPKEALQPFNLLIGQWRCTCTPAGTREEQQKGFWTETMAWQWQFQKNDAWLRFTIEKGKHFTAGTLRFLPDKDLYELTLKTPANDAVSFTGKLDKKNLTLERGTKDETQRLVFTLLHSNRFLYRYEVKPIGKNFFSKQYSVGATKEGEAFAAGDSRPQCIVSGGLGAIAVTHLGKTYYVCCSGCRTEFLENPEKYIKEFEKKKSGK